MSDLRPETSDAAVPLEGREYSQQELERLERYDHQRRSWELELLISGAVIFAFLGIPSVLDDWYLRREVHVSLIQFMALFAVYYYLKLVAYALIASFCVNFSMRAYWIGLVGLHKVFPDGIRWRQSKEGPISQRISRGNPDLPSLIAAADRISSLVFSSSSIAVILFLYSILFTGLLSLIAWGISTLAFGGERLIEILVTLLVIAWVPAAVGGILDRMLLDKPREVWEGRWYARLIHNVLSTFNWMSLKPLYSAIQLTLATNIRRQITIPLYIGGFIGILSVFMATYMWQLSERLPLFGYTLFPDVAVERGLDHRHYESLQPAGAIVRRAPTIQSDIIEDPYVRLFIPYSPLAHNDDLAELCPDVDPIPTQELTAPARFNARPPDDTVDAALGCLASFHRVYLNDQLLDLDYDFFSRGESGVRGIVAYLAVDDLPRGRNALRIERVEVEDENGDDEEDEQVVYFIPFWI